MWMEERTNGVPRGGERDRKTEKKEESRDVQMGDQESGQRRDQRTGRRGVRGDRGGAHKMGYLESGGGKDKEGRGKAGGRHRCKAVRQVEGGTEEQGHRCRIKSQVSSAPRDRAGARRGALPRPITGGSGENKELRSRRERLRGGLIRALAAAAPSGPLGELPYPSPGHLKGSSAH